VLFIFLESLWWVRFNKRNLENFKPKVQKILNFEQFLSLEIQLNYKNGFEKEEQLEHLGQQHNLY